VPATNEPASARLFYSAETAVPSHSHYRVMQDSQTFPPRRQGVRHDPIWADHLNTLAARIMRNVVAAKEKADAAAAAIAAQKKMIDDMEARARRK
jgi:hypothetical protein